MAFAATATRGVAPASLNLNSMSHMPAPPNFYDPDTSLNFSTSSYVADSPISSDDEEYDFNLDMVTMNMNFEQAYSMYSKLQKKNAMQSVDQLRRAQELNASKARTQQYVNSQSAHAISTTQLLNHSVPNSLLDTGSISMPQVVQGPIHESAANIRDIEGLAELGHTNTDNVDQFFSNTESDAIERFLDNLANGTLSNNDKDDTTFDSEVYSRLNPQLIFPDISADEVKKEITDAFQHPPVSSLRSFGTTGMFAMNQPIAHQGLELQTPLIPSASSTCPKLKSNVSRSVSPTDTYGSKRSSDDLDTLERISKCSRPNGNGNGKNLLTTEQKRLNHSLLEQKRRLLCREAYERCLRLVTNVEEYKKELAQALPLSKKKPSRKQLIKNGLPNLSKHTSLLKISNEITKIQGQNERLRALLAGKA